MWEMCVLVHVCERDVCKLRVWLREKEMEKVSTCVEEREREMKR